ncbi:hypothetical protein TNCV_3264011 [Trichonephila clavipes]|nr:hypothetical protein TNCV_3264011 [Trichonephila clavipes]
MQNPNDVRPFPDLLSSDSVVFAVSLVSIAEGTSQGFPQKSSLFAGGASQRLSLKSNRLLAGGASQRHPQNLNLPSLMILSKRYLGWASSLQPSIWYCDVYGVASLVGRGERDFRSGGPMGVKESSAMEVIFDRRLEVSF